jgi:hypothetical protein
MTCCKSCASIIAPANRRIDCDLAAGITKMGPPAKETPSNLLIYDVLINVYAPLVMQGSLSLQPTFTPVPRHQSNSNPERRLFNIAHI